MPRESWRAPRRGTLRLGRVAAPDAVVNAARRARRGGRAPPPACSGAVVQVCAAVDAGQRCETPSCEDRRCAPPRGAARRRPPTGTRGGQHALFGVDRGQCRLPRFAVASMPSTVGWILYSCTTTSRSSGRLATVAEHRVDGHRLPEHDVDPPAPPHRRRRKVVEPVPGERIAGTLQIGRFHGRPDRALPRPQDRCRGAAGAPSRADVLHRPACRKVRRDRLARWHDRDAGTILLTEARPHVSRDQRGGRDVVEQVVEQRARGRGRPAPRYRSACGTRHRRGARPGARASGAVDRR